MSKIVIFDWGGVVESHENNNQELKEARVRLIKSLNKSIDEEEILAKWTNKNSAGVHIGKTNDIEVIQDWVKTLTKAMNVDISFEEFKIKYQEEFAKVSFYKSVVEYAHSLKRRCNIGILSNLGPFDKARIDMQMNLKMFDYVFLSFEIGMRKPDKEVYEYVLKKLQVKPEDVLLIDDDLNNVIGAEKCGFQTCNACGYELFKMKEAVDEFLSDDKIE